MTAAPEVVAVVHITSTPMTRKRQPFFVNHHTPMCCICGQLGAEMDVEDARDVTRQHMRDLAVAANDAEFEDEDEL